MLVGVHTTWNSKFPDITFSHTSVDAFTVFSFCYSLSMYTYFQVPQCNTNTYFYINTCIIIHNPTWKEKRMKEVIYKQGKKTLRLLQDISHHNLWCTNLRFLAFIVTEKSSTNKKKKIKIKKEIFYINILQERKKNEGTVEQLSRESTMSLTQKVNNIAVYINFEVLAFIALRIL